MSKTWNILVVDDDDDVHAITALALKHKSYRGRPFSITEARSAAEGIEKLKAYTENTFAVAIIDVVMESSNAGLELCHYIRATFSSAIRIVLRTGQPGVAPEESILENYDIDHYLAKSEATDHRLFAVIRACLRMSEDVRSLERANAGLTVANAELVRQSKFRENVLVELAASEEYLEGMLQRARAIGEGKGQEGELARWAMTLSDVTKRVRNVFHPHDFRSHAEKALRGHSVLILQRSGKATRLTQSALAGVDASTTIAATWAEALGDLRTGRVDLLFVDWENLGIVNEAVRYNPNILAVLATTQEVFEEHGETIMSLPISSAVVINTAFGSGANFDPLMVNELVVTSGKLLSRDIFGLEKYLAWGVRVHEIVLGSSDERMDALRQLEAFASECRVRSSLRGKLATLTDELLMNAMWSAPVDSRGVQKYHKCNRRSVLHLLPEEAVTMRYASDGNMLAISVSDRFGALRRETAFRYLLKCFARTPAPEPTEAGNAGIGISMAYLATSNFVINCMPGAKTEVIGIIDLNHGARTSAVRPRSFHYFCTTTSA